MAEGSHLVVNVDVSRTAFWNFRDFKYIIARLAKHEGGVGSLEWRHDNQETNSSFDMIRRLKGSWFTVEHENQSGEAKKRHWKVAAVRPESAREYKFKIWDSTKNAPERETTILDYYQHEYKVLLAYPDLPVVETTKTITKRDEKGKIIFESPIIFPLEFCSMRPNQPYSYKLDEDQTSEMIEFAVQGPEQRLDEINRGLSMLGWEKDGFLDRCGLKICREQIRTKARMLDPPKLLFKGSDVNPGTSGKWQLTNKTFIAPNTAPLVSWGVMIVNSTQNGRPAFAESKAEAFVSMLVKQYKGFGGDIKTEKPLIQRQCRSDLATATELFYEDVRKEYCEMRPQMLVFILPDTNGQTYLRIKKLCDCKFGVYSQCVQARKARKSEYSYISNLLMKFNAKLGGTTNIIASQKPEQSPKPSGAKQPNLRHDFGKLVITPPGPATKSPLPATSPPPAMYIGADVSHPAPGGHTPSYAAMTVSMDKTATRYSAAVQTNGFRQEMISTQNLGYCLKPLLQKWIKDVSKGSLPDHVYYFRDGVGESRFKDLLVKEVADIRQIFRELNGIHSELKVKFTVVVAEKRHHIRFFPEGGRSGGADENGNPLPGIIVDRDVTDSRGNDIYLCSHKALKGTARPTHYIMLMDEANIPVDSFQKTLYEQCYQYIRSTTAVSLHPAVYYAHLASKRAQAHDDGPRNDPPQHKGKGKGPATSSSVESSEQPAPLLEMNNENEIRYGMWFI